MRWDGMNCDFACVGCCLKRCETHKTLLDLSRKTAGAVGTHVQAAVVDWINCTLSFFNILLSWFTSNV